MKIESSHHSSGYSNSQNKPKANMIWSRHHDDLFLPQDSIKLSYSKQGLQWALKQQGQLQQKARTKIQRQINLYKRNMFYTS